MKRLRQMLGFAEPVVAAEPEEGSVLRQQFITQTYARVIETIGLFNPKRVSIVEYLLMRDDPDVAFGSALLRAPLINAEWTVESRDPLIKAFIEWEMRKHYISFAEAASLAIGFGYQVVEKVWKAQPVSVDVKDADGVKEVEKRIPMAWTFSKFKPIDPKTITLHTDPDTDEWDGVEQYVYNAGPAQAPGLVGPERVALWSFRKADVFGRLTGYAMYRHSYPAWWDKSATRIYANRYFETYGGPVPIGRADASGRLNVDGQSIDGFSFVGGILQAYKTGNSIVLPSDRDENSKEYIYDIEFKELARGGESFEAYLRYLKEEILFGQLTPPRVGQARGGSELGSKEPAVQAEQMQEFHEKILGEFFTMLNEQVVEPQGRYNFPADQWEASKTRLVPSGISTGQKSLYRDCLFKAMDEEMVVGAGKHAPIYRRMKLDDMMDALHVPRPSSQELEEIEQEAAKDAEAQQAIDQQGGGKPMPDPAVSKGEQMALLEAIGHYEKFDLDMPVRGGQKAAETYSRAEIDQKFKDVRAEELDVAPPAPPQPIVINNEHHTHIEKGAIPIENKINVEPGATPTVHHHAGDTVINHGDVHLKADLNLKPGDKKTVKIVGPDGKESTATITPEDGGQKNS